MITTRDSTLHPPSDNVRVSYRILEAIATKEGTSPHELEQPLYDSIDPEALDALFQGHQRNGTIEFTYLGYRIIVSGDEEIEISE